jgi:hypothetical protein
METTVDRYVENMCAISGAWKLHGCHSAGVAAPPVVHYPVTCTHGRHGCHKHSRFSEATRPASNHTSPLGHHHRNAHPPTRNSHRRESSTRPFHDHSRVVRILDPVTHHHEHVAHHGGRSTLFSAVSGGRHVYRSTRDEHRAHEPHR